MKFELFSKSFKKIKIKKQLSKNLLNQPIFPSLPPYWPQQSLAVPFLHFNSHAKL
jgi:hypothetical protein